ncbi:MAG TPA: hypothetical protein VGB73_08555 [Pyrinomonadaceae bacterium]|jgi:hypothetical protein
MTDPKEDKKPTVKRREPKKVTPTGIFDNLRQIPQLHPVEEILGLVRPPQTPSDGQTPSVPLTPIAPEKDFNKRANSLERDALPSGLFPGSSKKIYDALYLRTRGAIKPCRTIRATKKDIAEWSGVRNRKTLDSHLRHLATCGLITREWELGSNDGYLFEVRLPEETPLMDRGGQRDRPSDQKLDRGTDQKRDSGGQSQIVENKAGSVEPKTFIKTKEEKTDDEAFAEFLAALKETTKELTGKEPAKAEAERWRELAELLMAELRIAAARTPSVSSVPAFLTEHLRRRLWKMEKKPQSDKLQVTSDKPTEEQGNSLPVKDCPSCGGSGWWYPHGYDGGVAKCLHNCLKTTPHEESI